MTSLFYFLLWLNLTYLGTMFIVSGYSVPPSGKQKVKSKTVYGEHTIQEGLFSSSEKKYLKYVSSFPNRYFSHWIICSLGYTRKNMKAG